GSGDIEQSTTRGLATWRNATNVPMFTDGFNHWALTSEGLATWTGNSIDPPARTADWQTYFNARYAFAVEMPATWEIGRESDNGDGAPLYSGDPDVMITASGSLSPEVLPGRPDSLALEPGFRSQPLVLNDGRQATLFVGRRGTRLEEDVVLVSSVTYLG